MYSEKLSFKSEGKIDVLRQKMREFSLVDVSCKKKKKLKEICQIRKNDIGEN